MMESWSARCEIILSVDDDRSLIQVSTETHIYLSVPGPGGVYSFLFNHFPRLEEYISVRLSQMFVYENTLSRSLELTLSIEHSVTCFPIHKANYDRTYSVSGPSA